MTIARITAAVLRTYRDSGQTKAIVDWLDERGRYGSTSGEPANPHMVALIARAEREGITVRIER